MPIAALRRPRAPWVDAHDGRAVPPPGFLDEVPVMVTRGQEVGAPHHDQAAPGDLLRIEPERMAFRCEHVSRPAADAAGLPTRAERVKEPHQCATLYDAHRSEVVHRQERLAAVLGNDRRE